MADIKIADLKRGVMDPADNEIILIYAKKSPEYLVYHADDRVLIHFADEAERATKQRHILAALSALRGQISGLIDGWRSPRPQEIRQSPSNRAAPSAASEGGRMAGKGKRAEAAAPAIIEREPSLVEGEPVPLEPKQAGASERTDGPRASGKQSSIWPWMRVAAWIGRQRRDRNEARARRYDRRVADAVVTGLEGNVGDALKLLTEIREDIVSERKSAAKSDYLVWAALNGLVFLLIIWGLSLNPFHVFADAPNKVHLIWTGAGAGVIGAFFSIAIGLRGRTLLVDLQKWTNRGDATLRLTVGTIGSAILVCFLLAGIVDVAGFKDKLARAPTDSDAVLISLVAGFIAGFSERAVGDLLGKFGLTITQDDNRPDVATETAKAVAATGIADTVKNGSGGAGETLDVSEQDEDSDGCLTDGPSPAPESLTRDDDLPITVGGVSADLPAK